MRRAHVRWPLMCAGLLPGSCALCQTERREAAERYAKLRKRLLVKSVWFHTQVGVCVHVSHVRIANLPRRPTAQLFGLERSLGVVMELDKHMAPELTCKVCCACALRTFPPRSVPHWRALHSNASVCCRCRSFWDADTAYARRACSGSPGPSRASTVPTVAR